MIRTLWHNNFERFTESLHDFNLYFENYKSQYGDQVSPQDYYSQIYLPQVAPFLRYILWSVLCEEVCKVDPRENLVVIDTQAGRVVSMQYHTKGTYSLKDYFGVDPGGDCIIDTDGNDIRISWGQKRRYFRSGLSRDGLEYILYKLQSFREQFSLERDYSELFGFHGQGLYSMLEGLFTEYDFLSSVRYLNRSENIYQIQEVYN